MHDIVMVHDYQVYSLYDREVVTGKTVITRDALSPSCFYVYEIKALPLI